MTKTRLEAFSDGVIAIIITIMVLEMKVPHSTEWEDLSKLIPVFLSYVLSFLMLGIYWVNHHHLVHAIPSVNSKIMWTNLHLLFWLSLIPFATGWMGESHFERNTVMLYAFLADACGIAYFLMILAIDRAHPKNEHLHALMKNQRRKGIMSNISYTIALILAYFQPAISLVIFIIVALIWFIPDKNIEHALSNK